MKGRSFFTGAALVVAVSGILAGCGASTNMTGQWADPTVSKGEFKKVLVIGLTDQGAMRRVFETQMCGDFSSHGIQSVASADHMPLEMQISEDNLRQQFKDMNIDAVLTARLLGVDQQADYIPGDTYVVPYDYYRGFYGYYNTVYPVVSTPGYWSTYSVAKVETNLYRVGDAKLVWGGVSETFDYADAMDGIRSFSHTVVSALIKDGFFEPTGKK